jgi:hypothetical protein
MGAANQLLAREKKGKGKREEAQFWRHSSAPTAAMTFQIDGRCVLID